MEWDRIDLMLRRHRELTVRLNAILQSVFAEETYAKSGAAGVFQKTITSDLAIHFGYRFATHGDVKLLLSSDDPHLQQVIIPGLELRLAWYLEQVSFFDRTPAFVPGEELLAGSADEEPRHRVTLLDRVVREEIQESLRDASNYYRTHAWERLYELRDDPFPPLRAVYEEWGRRLRLFDQHLFILCSKVLPEARSRVLEGNGAAAEEAATLVTDVLRAQGMLTADRTLRLEDNYDLLSTWTWLAVEMKLLLDATGDARPVALIELTDTLLEQAFTILEKTSRNDPDLRRKHYNPLLDHHTKDVHDLIRDDRFVTFHLLLNACTLLTKEKMEDGTRQRVLDSSVPNVTLLLRNLVDDVYRKVAEPALEPDLYWLALRLRVLNEFLRDLLFDSVRIVDDGKRIVPFVSSITGTDVDAALREFEIQPSTSASYVAQAGRKFLAWPGGGKDGRSNDCSETDRRFVRAFQRLAQQVDDYVQTKTGAGTPNEPRPMNVLLAANPGDGKSTLVETLQDVFGAQYKDFDCTRYGQWADLETDLKQWAGQPAHDLTRPVFIFFDELDALESADVYSHLLPLMWNAKVGEERLFGERRVVNFFAASRFPTCREYRLYLTNRSTDHPVRKGPDFVSRISSEIDLPRVRGAEQFRARVLIALRNLGKRARGDRRVQLSSAGVQELLIAAALDVSLVSARAVEKWVGSVPMRPDNNEPVMDRATGLPLALRDAARVEYERSRE